MSAKYSDQVINKYRRKSKKVMFDSYSEFKAFQQNNLDMVDISDIICSSDGKQISEIRKEIEEREGCDAVYWMTDTELERYIRSHK